MATVNVDPTSVVEFVDEAAFNDWLARHHDQRKKVWVSEQNCFALAFRVFNLKTEAGRERKIETFVAMLARGETVYPQKPKTKRGAQGK